MSTSFHLREMFPSDGAAAQQLMETDPETAEMSMTTVFRIDAYQAWRALKANMIGVVAEAPGVEGLVGVATVAFTDIQFDGQVVPAAFLDNLKVRHDYRGQGLGTELVQWRIDRARERFGENCVIVSGTTSDNTLSQATMKKWISQFAGPLILMPQPPRDSEAELPAGISVRAPHESELDAVAARSNQFYADYNLYAPLSASGLKALLAGDVYHYRIAVDAQGKMIAGMLLAERAALFYDQFRNVPPPLKMSGMLPPDERIRMM
ncbi:MAG: GNAT family N-acetyltransferase, partial [Chloroflexota bacterium]